MALVERVTALTPADFAELIDTRKRRETIIRQIIWLRLNIHLFCADITQEKSGN